MIKAVVFDMDGVLIDSEPFWKKAEKKVFAKVGIAMTTEMCNLTMGYRINEVAEYWYERMPWQGKTKEEVAREIVNEVINEIKENGKAMKGALNLLQWLKNNNYKIALASSSSMQIIQAVLEKLNIRDFFDVVQSAEHEEYGKPHPAVFISAAKRLDIHPMYCIVIEDSVNGVIAAKAAKMKAVAAPDASLRNDKRFMIADLIVDTLEAITPEVVEKIG